MTQAGAYIHAPTTGADADVDLCPSFSSHAARKYYQVLFLFLSLSVPQHLKELPSQFINPNIEILFVVHIFILFHGCALVHRDCLASKAHIPLSAQTN